MEEQIEFEPKRLDGVILVKPVVRRDPRGFFLETYHQRKYQENGIRGPLVQDNHSFSHRGALRGLHQLFQPVPVANEVGKTLRQCNGSNTKSSCS